jgi:hypothetical protein
MSLSLSAAVSRFEKMLPNFIIHCAIKRRQSLMYRAQISYVSCIADVVLFHFDYAENFKCAAQDQIQAAYYGQHQISLFTVVVKTKGASKSVKRTWATSLLLTQPNVSKRRCRHSQRTLYSWNVCVSPSFLPLLLCFPIPFICIHLT